MYFRSVRFYGKDIPLKGLALEMGARSKKTVLIVKQTFRDKGVAKRRIIWQKTIRVGLS